MTNFVFVLDTKRRPLDPCHPSVARKLLANGKAAVFRRYPFTIMLNREVNEPTQSLQLKIDPGSKTTGFALLSHDKVIWAAELEHRGQQIKAKLDSRRASRRNRRNRLRYRKPRFLNRVRKAGWLAPSLQHRVATILTWVHRLMRLTKVTEIAQELVRFAMQPMQNPESSGVAYQQGELQGYEVREYLLEKWNRTCAYCGATHVPLQVEHIQPRSRGGSNRVSNLTLACVPCNQRKGNRDIREFLKTKPHRLTNLLALAKAPLKDAAAINTTRWVLFHELSQACSAVTCGSGGRTKWNRSRLGLAKTHWLDAACVGTVESLQVLVSKPLKAQCKGQGTRQKSVLNKVGYPIQQRSLKPIFGWRAGDVAKWEGKTYQVTPRQTGSFELVGHGKPISRSGTKLIRIHRFDGYQYG